VDAYRKLLADSPACVEAYRGLNRLMGVLGKPALATAAAAVLDLLGESTPAERGQVKTLDQLNFPPGRLSLGALPLRPMLKPVVQTFDLVAPHLGPVYPMPQQVPLEDGAPATRAVRRLARVLGLSEVTVSVEGDEPARAGVGLPAGVRLNAQLARQPDGPIFRFWVGRALAEAVTAGALLARLPNQELDELIEALFAQRPEMAAQQLRKQLGRAVPRRVRKQLEQQRLDPVDSRLWDRYRADEQRRCDVIGMLICGNPKVAVAELAATTGVTGSPAMDPRLRDMMTFAVTDRYAVLHAAIWTRPPSQP
jgi:hypothetical protein